MNKIKFLIFVLATILLANSNLLASVPFFNFRSPFRDYGSGSSYANDRHAFDKMNYYGYYLGIQMPTGTIVEKFYAAKMDTCSTIVSCRNRFDVAWGYICTFYHSDNFRYPKPNTRFKNSKLLERAFLAHNTDDLYCYLVDSILVNIQNTTDRDSAAIEVLAKLVIRTDSLHRSIYNKGSASDTLFINQLAEEISSHAISNDVPYSFLNKASNDTIAAFCKYSQIMNSLANKVHYTKPQLKLAVEFMYHDTIDVAGPRPKILAGHDTLLAKINAIDINFFVLMPGLRNSYLQLVNNLTSKIGSRKLGVRFSFATGDDDQYYQYSFASQKQFFDELNSKLTNMKYLSLYTGQMLDGKFDATVSTDPNQHWLALSQWVGKPFLIFVDQFEEYGLDDRQWNSSGTVNVDSSGSVSITKDSYIINDTTYNELAQVIAKMSTNGETDPDPGNFHKLVIYKDASNYIEFYSRKDTLNTNVRTNGNDHHQMLTGTLVGSGENDYQIFVSSGSVCFYFNNVNKQNEYLSSYNPSAVGRFDQSTKVKILTGTYSSINSYYVDSIQAIHKDPFPPKVDIPSTWVNGSTVYANIHVDKLSDVDIYLERYCKSCTFPRQGTIYVTTIDSLSTGGPTQVSFTFTNQPAYDYRWLAIADVRQGGGIDSAFGMGFYYNGSTALASAKGFEVVHAELPRAFSLSQNFPNPFNPSTTIRFDIPGGKQCNISLKVYNVRGQVVKILVDSEKRDPGTYTIFWDGRDIMGGRLPSGVYFYRLEAGEFVATRKMVLLK